jgi:NTP pyrophosphatase (non-canonical NTP hydrolase)
MESFNEYGAFVDRMWFSKADGILLAGNRKDDQRDLAIMALGLCGEAGEVTEKIKKHIRDNYFNREEILKELGDVLFYTIKIAQHYGFVASDVPSANVIKLESRKARGVQRGSGDNR